MTRPRIIIDPGGLDVLNPGCGQFRYVVDLVRGLHSLAPRASFVFLGGTPSPPTELAPIFNSGGHWRYRYFARPTGRGAMYREQVALAAIACRERADLFHSLHTTIPVFAPCRLVATVHDLMFELFVEYAEAVRSRPYRLHRWAVRHRVWRAICISETTANDVRRLWGLSCRRLAVVLHGTNFVLPTTAPSFMEQIGSAVLILTPYNLEPRKNCRVMLSAFAKLRTAVPTAKLVLFGRSAVTPQREAEFDAACVRLGIADSVLRTGFLQDEHLRYLYHRADVFVFPSLYEGFGYPLLEAMAAGGCVVTRDCGAMAELVRDAGLLIDVTNAEAVSTAILQLLRDPVLAARLRRVATERAKEFTITRMAEQTWQVYQAALPVIA